MDKERKYLLNCRKLAHGYHWYYKKLLC